MPNDDDDGQDHLFKFIPLKEVDRSATFAEVATPKVLHDMTISLCLAKKKRPLRLCIKSKHCSYHGILKNQAWLRFSVQRCAKSRPAAPPCQSLDHADIAWKEQCSDHQFMHNLSGRFFFFFGQGSRSTEACMRAVIEPCTEMYPWLAVMISVDFKLERGTSNAIIE